MSAVGRLLLKILRDVVRINPVRAANCNVVDVKKEDLNFCACSL